MSVGCIKYPRQSSISLSQRVQPTLKTGNAKPPPQTRYQPLKTIQHHLRNGMVAGIIGNIFDTHSQNRQALFYHYRDITRARAQKNFYQNDKYSGMK